MKLRMTLLSDMIPGSGEGLAGIIDRDISFDECGIPYIPAKRVKGLLRESAKELKDAGLLSNEIKEIFGEGGQDKGCNFKLDNGYLENHRNFRNLLDYCQNDRNNDRNENPNTIFNRESTLDYFTYTRTQTTIDQENGTAKEDTLRVSRALKRGLIFDFDITFPSEYKDDIKKIVRVTRYMGTSRTRGMGNIKLAMTEDSPIGDKGNHLSTPPFKDDELCIVPVTITNQNQLSVNIQIGHGQISEKFISGGYLLGALAQQYIEDKSNSISGYHPSDDSDFRDIFLSGKVTFQNAYIMHDRECFYPSPYSIVKEKDAEDYFDLVRDVDQKEIDEKSIATKGEIGEFSVIYSDGWTRVKNASTEIEYHHRRPEDKSIGHAQKTESLEDLGAFFQYEVMNPGQKFKGGIRGKYEYLGKLSEILDDKMTLYLGKSKTAQYGKVKVEFGKIEQVHSSQRMWKSSKNIVITLKSDMILLNDLGFPVPDKDILKSEIASALGVGDKELSIERAFLKFKKIGGFLGVWRLPKIQTPALSAGSVIVLKNESGKDIDISGISRKSFGMRTEEGFGMIEIDYHGLCKIKKEELTPIIAVFPDNLKFIKSFIERILSNKIKEEVKEKAIRRANNDFEKPDVKNLSGSFLNKMFIFVSKSNRFEETEEKLKELKKSARDNLCKINKSLHILGDLEHIDQSDFEKNTIGNINDWNIKGLEKIIADSGLTVDFYKSNDRVFELYKDYVKNYLNILKFKKRGQK